jgi:hypothetical protein
MKALNNELSISFKKVAPDKYKLKQIIDGHPIEYILEKSEVRAFIETLDNQIV